MTNKNYYEQRGRLNIFSLPDLEKKYGKKMKLFTDCKNCEYNYYGHLVTKDCGNYEPKLED